MVDTSVGAGFALKDFSIPAYNLAFLKAHIVKINNETKISFVYICTSIPFSLGDVVEVVRTAFEKLQDQTIYIPILVSSNNF